MTNPGAAIKLLITYAICIPMAIIVGYVLTDPMDYGTLGFLGLVIALIISPVFIKWHYPIMVFGLAFPAYMFFLVGNPPCWQVVVMLSLGIAIVERTMNSERRFISIPSMTWPLLFTVAVLIFTASLTGGFGLHQLGGSTGGGKKYIVALLGMATYFALSSRRIPREHSNFYIGLYFLSALPTFISDLFPFLPHPLNYINLLFPPTTMSSVDVTLGISRLGSLSTTAVAVVFFMLARYGLRGLFDGPNIFRAPLLLLMLVLTMLGGYRGTLFTNFIILVVLFFLEGLHRTRFMLVALMGLAMMAALLVPLANHLPYTFQRSLAILPVLNLDPQARMDTEGSSEWRLQMWRDLWPKVPDYLLLGKGYLLKSDDFVMIGNTALANGYAGQLDASSVGLGASGDYHNGPLSTLIPLGLWGGIGFLWVTLAGLRVLYRNWKYGDPELRTINGFLLAWYLQRYIMFFFIFGGFEADIGLFARTVGFSVALNWGLRGPHRAAAPAVSFKPLAPVQRQPQLA